MPKHISEHNPSQLALFTDPIEVFFVDAKGWHAYFAVDLSKIRTVGSDFLCPENCPYAYSPHFMITFDGYSYTKLCTLDILKHHPFPFDKKILEDYHA